MARDLGGKTIGGYKLGEVLARGAHSTVYAAEHETTGQAAAVKVWSADFAKDKAAIPRIIADLQKATAVTHASLPRVLDIGTCEYKGKRHVYVASERLRGTSLRARLGSQKDKALPLHVALQIASDVGAALQAIHRAGGTHRHVNSGAVFLAEPPADAGAGAGPADTGEERAYLLDLGTALVSHDGEAKGDKSGKNDLKGGRKGPQEDIRGLALLVAEMLGGTGATAATDAAGHALLPLRERNRRVPARIDAVLRTALGETLGQTERYGSIAAFTAALLGTGEAQPALGVWSEDGRAAAPLRRAGFGLGWAALLAIVGGGGVGYWWYSQESGTAQPAAVHDLASAADATFAAPNQPPPGDKPGTGTELAPPAPPPEATADMATRVWPRRTGPTIPPLRDADQATPTSPAAPGAGAQAPASGAPAGTASAGSATPTVPSAPAASAAAPAAQNQKPQARPGTTDSPPPRPDGPKEVK